MTGTDTTQPFIYHRSHHIHSWLKETGTCLLQAPNILLYHFVSTKSLLSTTLLKALSRYTLISWVMPLVYLCYSQLSPSGCSAPLPPRTEWTFLGCRPLSLVCLSSPQTAFYLNGLRVTREACLLIISTNSFLSERITCNNEKLYRPFIEIRGVQIIRKDVRGHEIELQTGLLWNIRSYWANIRIIMF